MKEDTKKKAGLVHRKIYTIQYIYTTVQLKKREFKDGGSETVSGGKGRREARVW